MTEEASKMIKKYGKGIDWNKRGAVIRAKVVCQGCGKVIFSDSTESVEFVLPKHSDAQFCHTDCKDKRWDSPIRSIPRWED